MKVKAKTRKIASKRFKITKNGKILRAIQGSRHLRNNKSKRQTRRYKVGGQVSESFAQMIRRLLPYG